MSSANWIKPEAPGPDQASLRRKLEDLRETLHISNAHWSSWEEEFIHDMAEKLALPTIYVTPKQVSIIEDLWERI